MSVAVTGTSVSISILSTFSLNVMDFLRSLGVGVAVGVVAGVIGLVSTSVAATIFFMICGVESVDSMKLKL